MRVAEEQEESTEYSKSFMNDLFWFISRVRKEYGEDIFTQDRVYKMLDSFDPELKYIVMEEFITGNINVTMRIKRVSSEIKMKINAIKHIRAATKCGLKEAKEITDLADNGEIVEIEGDWSREIYITLQQNLQGTGYELV
jgi:hypothetical protein